MKSIGATQTWPLLRLRKREFATKVHKILRWSYAAKSWEVEVWRASGDYQHLFAISASRAEATKRTIVQRHWVSFSRKLHKFNGARSSLMACK